MKPRSSRHFTSSLSLLSAAIVLTAALLLGSLPASATDFYWDTNGVAAPGPTTAVPGDDVIQGGSGAWGPSNFNWTTSPTDSSGVNHNAWTNASVGSTGTHAVFFGGTAGTVTLGGAGANTLGTSANFGVNSLNFTTSGYTLTGDTLRFVYSGTTNGSINVGSGITATINTAINMSAPSGSGLTAGTASGNISANVLITGGGTLNMGGGNSNGGFTIDGGTVVDVKGGGFSGWSLSSINNGSTLRVSQANLVPGAASLRTTAGSGTFNVAGYANTVSNLGGLLAVTNSATSSVTLGLTLLNNGLTHTGVISNGSGKLSLATTGGQFQGGGFNSTIGFATQTFAGANTYTGFTSLGRGTVELDFSNAAAPASNILYNSGFGTAIGDDGKLIIDRPLATVGGTANSAVGSLATLTLIGKASTANSQQFNGLKLTGGAANILINPASGGSVTVNLGSTLERSSGSLINFATTNSVTALSGSAVISAAFGTASTVLKDANGAAFAVIAGRDWAAKDPANTAVVTATYTNSSPTGFTANADITTPTAGAAANDTRLGANTTISTLRYGNSTARTGIDLGGNTLTTGGILTSQAMGNSGSFLTRGTLTSPGSDIVLAAYQQTIFGLNTVLANGTSATGFTKGGSGIVIASASSTYTGPLTVHEGGLILTGQSTPSVINVNGSQTDLTGVQPPNASTTGAYVQLGYANALGSLGTGPINLGPRALLAIKRSDTFTLNNNTQGAGGLTQAWSGTTVLVSAGTAKYNHVGDTTITAGTLRLDYSASNTGILNDNTRLVLGGGTLESASVVARDHGEIIRELALLSGASTITRTGNATGILQLRGITDGGVAGSTVNFTATGIANTTATNTANILGTRARFTVGSSGTYDWAVGNGNITPLAAGSYTALALGAGTDTNNSLQALTGATTFTGSRTTNTLKLTNASGAGQVLDIAAGNTLTLTAGGLLVTGADAVQITSGTLRSNTATNSDLIIHQYNAGGLTIGSTIINGIGGSTLTKSGDGPLTLAGANTYTGITFLNGGVTSISSNANLGAVATGSGLYLSGGTLRATADVILSNGAVGTNNRNVVLNGVGGTFDVDATRTLTIGGAITGPGGLTKTGLGTLDIRDASAFLGPTTVASGTLRFGGGANPARSDVTVAAGGTIDVAGNGNFLGSLSGAGTVTNTGAAATLTVGGLHNDTSFSGLLTNGPNALTLDKAGAGTLTLTGSHTYTGGTTISGGVVALSGAGNLPDTTAVNVSSAAGSFDISAISAADETIRTLAGGTGSQVVLGSKNLAIGAAFGNVNVTAATNAGTTITVASVPSYLTVGSGMLGRTVTAISGSTVTLNGSANSNISSSTSIVVYPVPGDTVFAGVISGAGGISKDGSANLTLSGANTFSGTTTIDRGVVTVTNASGLGSTAGGTRINYNGNTSGGRLDIAAAVGTSLTIDESITVAGGRFGSNYSFGFRATTGTVNLTTPLLLEGGSEYRLSATGSATVLNYQAGLARTGASGGLLLFDNTNSAITNYNAAIDNNGSTVEFLGNGTHVLNAVSTEVGQLQIDYGSGGSVKLGVNNAFPATSQLRIGLDTANTSTDATAPVGTLDMAGYDLSVARIEGGNGNTTATTASRRITNSTSGTSLLTIGSASTNTTFDGVIENGLAGGRVAITKRLANAQTLSGSIANTYTGLTTVTGGTLILAKTAGINAIGGDVVIGDGATTAGLDIVRLTNSDQIADTSLVSFGGTGANAGILRLNNQSETLGGLGSVGGAGIVENESGSAGTSTLTVNVASGIQSFAGILRNGDGAGTDGTLAFVKSGAGTQTLAGLNTYTGPTTVSGGTLLVSGSHTGGGAYAVDAGGTLGGAGSITSAVSVSGVLSPGASVESFATGALTFNNGATFAYEFDSSTGGADLQIVSGNLGLSGSVALTLADLAASPVALDNGTIFSLFSYNGTWNGGLFSFDGTVLQDNDEFDSGLNKFAIKYDATVGGSNYSEQQLAGGKFVNIVVVPEPSTAVLLGGLTGILLLRRRLRAA
jgi:autotransporter-associated beta strand protein